MSKQPLIKQDGIILEALSNAMFRVKLENAAARGADAWPESVLPGFDN